MLVTVLVAKVEALEAEVAALRRQVGRDSSNSSQPPSADGPAARPAAVALRRGGGGRPQGGQRGRRGWGLERVAVPDYTQAVEPGLCGGCGADTGGAPGRIASAVQVFDIPQFALRVTEYRMMRRDCGCGHATTARPPAGAGITGGPTCYGPNVVAAATLLASSDVVGIERTAGLMSALLGADVSTGFVSRCLVRLDDAITQAGFEDALKTTLRGADVLGTDETTAPLATTAKTEGCSNPHVYTARTMNAYTGGGPDLVWYGAAGTRAKTAINAFGILQDYTGVLVRDDYGGYLSYDEQLTGVQQCISHLLRHLDDVAAIVDPTQPHAQAWTGQAARSLREAITAVRTARTAGAASLDADLLASLRRDYDHAVTVGISTNLSRRWHNGNHPGLVLAQRLHRKAEQVWLFTTRFDVPATNNGSEHAIRGYKIAAKISGCWRTLATLQRHCRIRSYLTTTTNHGRPPRQAIHDALTGNTWMPPATA